MRAKRPGDSKGSGNSVTQSASLLGATVLPGVRGGSYYLESKFVSHVVRDFGLVASPCCNCVSCGLCFFVFLSSLYV